MDAEFSKSWVNIVGKDKSIEQLHEEIVGVVTQYQTFLRENPERVDF